LYVALSITYFRVDVFYHSKKDDDILLGLITPTLLLANWAFITKATEIRPDTLAFAFFISAIAVLYKIHGSLLRGFLWIITGPRVLGKPKSLLLWPGILGRLPYRCNPE